MSLVQLYHLFSSRNWLLFQVYTLLCTFLHLLWLPSSEVQLWDLAAAHKGVRIAVGLEDISWHFRDVGVITYYSWQGDFSQWTALPRSENSFILPPKPAVDRKWHYTFFPSIFFYSRFLQNYFPLTPTLFFFPAKTKLKFLVFKLNALSHPLSNLNCISAI